MKTNKRFVGLISFVLLLFLFCFKGEVSANELGDGFLEGPIDEIELLEIDLEGKIYEEVTFEEDDGTMATVSVSRVFPKNGITPYALTRGRGYRFNYNGGLDRYSFVVWVDSSIYKIRTLNDLQYTWRNGTVRSTSIRKLSDLRGRVQLVIDTPLGGTKTETANVQLNKQGRGSGWHILVLRNTRGKGIKLQD